MSFCKITHLQPRAASFAHLLSSKSSNLDATQLWYCDKRDNNAITRPHRRHQHGLLHYVSRHCGGKKAAILFPEKFGKTRIRTECNGFQVDNSNPLLNWVKVINPSIHFLYPLNPSVGSRGGWSLSQRSSGKWRSTLWTGGQSITGPQGDKQDK